MKSVKAQLQHRFGASVAEVDHHELWQRRGSPSPASRADYKGVEGLLDDAERYLHGQDFECSSVERQVVTIDD